MGPSSAVSAIAQRRPTTRRQRATLADGFLSRINSGQAYGLSTPSPTRGTRAVPLCVGYVSDEKVFSLISSLPSSLSADESSVFVPMVSPYLPPMCLLADVHGGRVA